MTVAFIAPPVAVALAKHPLVDRYDLSTLRAVLSGAAPLDDDLGRAVADRLGCPVVQGYGMTELSPVSHFTPFDGGKQLVGSAAPLELRRLDGGQCGVQAHRSRHRRRDRHSHSGVSARPANCGSKAPT